MRSADRSKLLHGFVLCFLRDLGHLACVGRRSLGSRRPRVRSTSTTSGRSCQRWPPITLWVFGDRGQLTISSDAGLSISNTSTSGVDGSSTKLTLRPAVDYFVLNNVSVGGFVGLDYTTASGAHATTFAIGPRVGYNLSFRSCFRSGPSWASRTRARALRAMSWCPALPAPTATTWR